MKGDVNMKNIKLAKKEYIVIEKKEMEGIMRDINLFAAMIKKEAVRAESHNSDFTTGLDLVTLLAMTDAMANYISDIRDELV